MDNFVQITVFCPPEPRLDAFVYKNAGKLYCVFYDIFYRLTSSVLFNLIFFMSTSQTSFRFLQQERIGQRRKRPV